MRTNDVNLLAEAYSIIKEQSPLLNNPMMAAAQGAIQSVQPYAAGAIAGTKQLGQNLAGAVTGSQQAPQSPVAAAQGAFSQEQIRQAAQGVIQALGLPPTSLQAVINGLHTIAVDVITKNSSQKPVNFGGYQQHIKDTIAAQPPLRGFN